LETEDIEVDVVASTMRERRCGIGRRLVAAGKETLPAPI
jgi:hypothetical protein